MKLESQPTTLPIQNFDETVGKKAFQRHSVLFGGDCKRAIITGCSGAGKTSILLTLLLHRHGLRFKNIYICSKSLCQPKYQFLRHLIQPMSDIGYYEFSDVNNMIPPTDVEEYSVVIFDDIQCTGQSTIKEYLSFGRHKNVDCFYLCQTFSAAPKQLIRDNCNLLVLFRQDSTNLKHIYDDYVGGDMTYDQFRDIGRTCWQDPFGVLVIDLDCCLNSGRYRKGFDTYIHI